VGALVVGACAQEASVPSGVDRGTGGVVAGDQPDVDAVIEATRAAESAAVVLNLEVESPVGGGNVELDGDVSRDDVGTVVGSVDGDGESYGIEMRADGDTAWITSDAPGFVDALPTDATWVEGSIEDLRADDIWTGLDTTFDVLSVLRGVDGLTETGTTEVGGDQLRLFEGDVDWEAALDACDPEERVALEDTITLSGDAEMRTFTVDLGVDDEDIVRMLQVEVVAGPPADGAEDMPFGDEITLRIGLEVESIGHDTEEPDAPPADDTVAISEVPEVAEMLAEGL
jgi:hypothetical protein